MVTSPARSNSPTSNRYTHTSCFTCTPHTYKVITRTVQYMSQQQSACIIFPFSLPFCTTNPATYTHTHVIVSLWQPLYVLEYRYIQYVQVYICVCVFWGRGVKRIARETEKTNVDVGTLFSSTSLRASSVAGASEARKRQGKKIGIKYEFLLLYGREWLLLCRRVWKGCPKE